MKLFTNKSIVAFLLASTALVSCGKKDSNNTAQTASNISKDADSRILGSWKILEKNAIDDKTGEEIPSMKLRLILTIGNDKLSYTSLIIDNNKVTCKAEISTNNFNVSKEKIVINDEKSNTSTPDKNTKCSASMGKVTMLYSIESNDVINLKSEDGK